jgi:hypothetical protein
MASLLPRELLDIVMGYLLKDDSSLKSASLVCRFLVAPSQSRLFSIICLRPPPHKKRQFSGCRSFPAHIPTDSKRGFKSSIEAFSRVVAASPHLLGYVRCLHLHGSPYPLVPRLPPDHRDWLNSQSRHLMTFLPRIAPRLRSFGMHLIDWKTLLPEVMKMIAGIFESGLLSSLSLIDTASLPVSVLASCGRLQHLNLQVEGAWASAALAACRVSERHQSKRCLISLELRNSKIDWFSTEDYIFDISHLRYLDFLGHLDFARIYEKCSASLRVLQMEGETLFTHVISLALIYDFHSQVPAGCFRCL